MVTSHTGRARSAGVQMRDEADRHRAHEGPERGPEGAGDGVADRRGEQGRSDHGGRFLPRRPEHHHRREPEGCRAEQVDAVRQLHRRNTCRAEEPRPQPTSEHRTDDQGKEGHRGRAQPREAGEEVTGLQLAHPLGQGEAREQDHHRAERGHARVERPDPRRDGLADEAGDQRGEQLGGEVQLPDARADESDGADCHSGHRGGERLGEVLAEEQHRARRGEAVGEEHHRPRVRKPGAGDGVDADARLPRADASGLDFPRHGVEADDAVQGHRHGRGAEQHHSLLSGDADGQLELGGQAGDLHVCDPELPGELAHQTLGVLGAVAAGLSTASGGEEQRERGVGVLGRGRRGAHGD